MNKDCIKLLSYAFYGDKKRKIKVQNDNDLEIICTLINALSGTAEEFCNGSVNVKPLRHRLTKEPVELSAVSNEIAYFLSGVCSQLNFICRISSVYPPQEKELLKQMSVATKHTLQFNSQGSDLLMCSFNYNETSDFIAVWPELFSAGVLLAMPLAEVDSVFTQDMQSDSEYIEYTYECMKELGVPIDFSEDTYKIKSIVVSRFAKKAKKSEANKTE